MITTLIIATCSLVLLLVVIGGAAHSNRWTTVNHCARCHTPYECVPGGCMDQSGLCLDCYATSVRDGANSHVPQTHNLVSHS